MCLWRVRSQGAHSLSVQQCNSDATYCNGKTDAVVVLKDTKAPNWSDVSSSLSTVYPVRDNFKDTTTLSARVSEALTSAKVEIRKSGGPLVRTIKLGREDKGKVVARWNGRKGNGSLVPNGKYLFRFVGADKAGLVGKSNDKAVNVSDKSLVKKSLTKVVSAFGSFRGNGSGSCSDLFRLSYDNVRFDWPKGVGYYSNAYCRGRGTEDLAIGGHSIGLKRAKRYGQVSISAFGAGASRHAGPGGLLSIRTNGKLGATARLGTAPGWYGVRGLKLAKYAKGARLRWLVGTVNGNWYDVKEFRISYTYFVLQ